MGRKANREELGKKLKKGKGKAGRESGKRKGLSTWMLSILSVQNLSCLDA